MIIRSESNKNFWSYYFCCEDSFISEPQKNEYCFCHYDQRFVEFYFIFHLAGIISFEVQSN